MSNKNLFYGNWKNFVGGHKLNEMEQQYRRLIYNATQIATKNPSVLPFGDIFGDKLRVAIPFEQKNLGKVQIILDYIYGMQGSGITATITDQVKQVRAKVAGRDTIQEIADFVVTTKQSVQNPKTGDWQVKESSTTIANSLRKLGVKAKQEIQEEETKLSNAKKEVEADESKKQALDWIIQTAEWRLESAKNRLIAVTKMSEWWQMNQSKIVQDVELVKFAASLGNTRFANGGWDTFDKEDDSKIGERNNDYSIVLSRAPIDVLRMSDFPDEDIESCHSSGGTWFYCTLAEAQNEGAIAYAVRTEDLEGLDLNQPEIFADQQEDVEGITPLQRVRIRALKDSDKDTIIGVTEIKTYPTQRLNGFRTEVFKAVTEAQKDLLIKTNEDGTKQLNITSDFNNLSTLGGSYFDNRLGPIVVEMFKILQKEEKVEQTEEQQAFFKQLEGFAPIKYAGRDKEYKQYTGDDDEDDDEDGFARDEAENEFNRGVRAVRETFLSHSCNFEWQYGEGYADMDLDVSFVVKFAEEAFTETFLNVKNESILDRLLKELFTDSGGDLVYPDAPLSEVFVVKSSGVVSIDIHYTNRHTDAEDFRREMFDLAQFAQNHPRRDLEAEIINILTEAGYMESSGVETEGQKLATLIQWTNENTEHFKAEQRGKIVDFQFMPDKRRATSSDAYTNYGKRSWLVAKLTQDQTDAFRSYAVSLAIRIADDLLQEPIFNKYFRPLLQSQTLGVAQTFEVEDEAGIKRYKDVNQQQFDFPFNKNSGTSRGLGTFNTSLEKGKYDLTNGITFKISFLFDRYKEGTLGYGYDQSDKTNWLYADTTIHFDIDRISVQQMARFIEGLEENPQTVANAISEILRKEISKNPVTMQRTPEQRGYQTRYEAEQEEKEKSETNLTEAKKRIIKERLLNWYKKNKGRK